MFWLVGAGGPIQPLAALSGGWIALRRRPSGPPSDRLEGRSKGRVEAAIPLVGRRVPPARAR
jgi:hypothetical protein